MTPTNRCIAPLLATAVFFACSLSNAQADLVLTHNEAATLQGEVDNRVTNNGTIYANEAHEPLTLTGEVDGAGTYSGNVTFDGVFRPGNSPASVNFENNLAFGSGNLLTMEIGGTTPGSEHDRLNIGGVFTPGGTLEVVLIDVGGGVYAPKAGDTFEIFSWGSLNGVFATIELPALSPDLQWDDSQLYVNGSLSVVPEPAWIGALAVLLGCRYGRRGGTLDSRH